MKLFTVIFAGIIALQSQAGSVGTMNGKKEYLVTTELKSKMSVSELKDQFSQFAAFIQNGYSAYKITYRTNDTDNSEITASGVVFIPDGNGRYPLLNYNHGTIFPSEENTAPSYLSRYSSELKIGKLFAAKGYVVAMPDYIGYGASKNLQHPYGAYKVIAASVIDMLYATKEFCEKNKINLSGKNFFSGWSEGAAVGLATVKLLEENHRGFFTPSATVLNAGPYYTSSFVNLVLGAQRPLQYMNTYVWVLQSYNRVYRINKPGNYYFTEPSATALRSGPEATISTDAQKLFTPTFRQNYASGTDSLLQKAVMDNDLWNWKPMSKVVFCHGDADAYVPLFNSEKAYNEMLAKGADVSLEVFKGATHSSGVYKFLQQAFVTFEKSK